MAETTTIEIHREDPEEELGMRIVGGKDTPLGNIVVQEVLRDSVIAADGRIAPGDHILEVGKPPGSPTASLGWKSWAISAAGSFRALLRPLCQQHCVSAGAQEHFWHSFQPDSYFPCISDSFLEFRVFWIK